MEDIEKIRKKFRNYLNEKVEKKELSQVDADTQYSDADYPRKHAEELGIDYFESFKNDDNFENLIKILQENFERNGKNPTTINSYKKALKNFKDFYMKEYNNKISLNTIINLYKSGLFKRWNDEKYKWQAVKHFQENWNIDADNFSEMYKKATELTYNLLNQGGIKRPIQMISDYCNEGWEENIKAAFKNLFNETKDTAERINTFLSEIEKINTERNKANGNANWSSYHDLNVVCTYLWLMYPDKYYMYKYSVVKEITETINYASSPVRKSDSASNILNFNNNQKLYEDIRNEIIKDKELLNFENSLTDETCYKDEKNRLLTQDLGFFIYQRKTAENDTEGRTMNNVNIPLNQILYGPPGTGKTYNTVLKAMSIIDSTEYKDVSEEQYSALKIRFDEFKKAGQIEFVTFHQSYSYEEFVEGIKPYIPEWGTTENADVRYIGENGIFKEICKKARQIKTDKFSKKIDFSKTRVFKMSLGANRKNDTDDIYNYCLTNNVVALGWGEDKDFSNCKTSEDFKKIDSTWGAKAVEIFKNWMRIGDIILISNGNSNIKAIAQITGDYEFHNDREIRYCQYRNVKWLYNGDDIPVSKFYDKQLADQTIYGFYYKDREGKEDYNSSINTIVLNEIITGSINCLEEKPYILIIDEINRGDVSKIFGELITLIEEDKRIGNKYQMKITLPYSKESFGVPNNLYIIGTMNTADRSIALLDTALRRRFDFEEIMPRPELLGGKVVEGINLQTLLTRINERITDKYDRDHQIGHSYLMGINTKEQLERAYKNRILPLLNEYFYNESKTVAEILNCAEDDLKTGDIISILDKAQGM